MKFTTKHALAIIGAFLALGIWLEVRVIYAEWPTNYFTLAILNVGQGEAVYIETPKHHRLLIDGGATHAILGELSKFVPFYSRSLDAVILTGPEDERVGGLIDVLSSYRTGTIIIPSATSSSQLFEQFQHKISELGIATTSVERGTVLNFGDGVYLTILYPDHTSLENEEQGSLMSRLTFGSASALLTAGAPAAFEDYILQQNGTSTLASTILATFYSSPKNAASQKFIQALTPQWVVVSASSKNQGQALVDSSFSPDSTTPVLYTAQEGTIIFHCTKQACFRVVH